MRLPTGRRSRNLEDRRAAGGRGLRVGGGLGLGGIVLLLVLGLLTGQNPLALLGVLQDTGAGSGAAPVTEAELAAEEDQVLFVSAVLDDVQAAWARLLPSQGRAYEEATLVLFRGATQSACGAGQSAMGPFYCPADQRVYLDLSFFEDLHSRFGAPGDFAQAYVIAHEIGHHVQHLLGIEARMRQLQDQNPARANALSVELELQADCFAGIWGYSTARRDLLDPGDLEEGLEAAAAIGDDRIQRMSGGRVVPESWTHGSSAARVAAFRRGLETGRCD